MQPVSLAADTGCSKGSLRKLLEERDIAAYNPIHTKQENSMVFRGDFSYHGDHLISQNGKTLDRGTFHKRQRAYKYVKNQKYRQACPIKDTCLPPGHRQR